MDVQRTLEELPFLSPSSRIFGGILYGPCLVNWASSQKIAMIARGSSALFQLSNNSKIVGATKKNGEYGRKK